MENNMEEGPCFGGNSAKESHDVSRSYAGRVSTAMKEGTQQPLTMMTANETSQMPDADDDELMQANPGVAEPDTPDIVKSAD